MAIGAQPTAPQALLNTPKRRDAVRRWDGIAQTNAAWDGLRRDPDLWNPGNDCVVYLYREGTSGRGPSFIVPYFAVKAAGCASWLFDGLNFSASTRGSQSGSSDGSSGESSPVSVSGKRELYIGACGMTGQEVFDWHITTRNFFAWLMGKPLVGECLSHALEKLLERLQLYRGHAIDNLQGVLDYAKDLGYLNFVDCPDHALAMLSFAEKHKLRSLYIDAFAHCVGLSERLPASVEYSHIGRLSKALISRAYLEMDLHVGRATSSVGLFLEDELSAAHVGLFKGARTHLEDFRTFLQSYCISKYGYWPPTSDTSFSKPLYQSMAREFRSLYDYLADKTSSDPTTKQQPAAGGICVLQNVQAFNSRHKYMALPYALPLVPTLPTGEGLTQTQRVRRTFGFGGKESSNRRSDAIREALSQATNAEDSATMSSPLVRAYMTFEDTSSVESEDQVSVTDARRVRWILIYAMVQLLTSLTHAPPEVRVPQAAPYPLCCLTIGLPPWNTATEAEPVPTTIRKSSPLSALSNISETSLASVSTPPTSIQPDCENSNYFDYLPTSKRRDSTYDLSRSSTSETEASGGSVPGFPRALPRNLSRRKSSTKLLPSTSELSQILSLPRKKSHAINQTTGSTSSTATHIKSSSLPLVGSPPWSRTPIRSQSTMSSNSLVLTMPALCWNGDDADTDSSDSSSAKVRSSGDGEGSSTSGGDIDSEEEPLSPALEKSGFFSKSFDPYYSGNKKDETPSALNYLIDPSQVMPIVRTLEEDLSDLRNWGFGKMEEMVTMEDVLVGYAR